MKAMILAAGRGERMRPLTDRVPKPLLEVDGKPLIVYHLEALAGAGFGEVVINLSWLGDQIRARLGDGREFGLAIEYSEEPEALETAGGILQALPLLGDRFIVVNADIHTDYDFSRLRERDSLVHLVLVPNPPQHPLGDFALRGSRVTNETMDCHTFSCIAQYRAAFFDGLDPGKRALSPLLRAAIERGELSGELYRGRWSDVGTAERLDALDGECS